MGKQNDNLLKNMKDYEQKKKIEQQESKVYGRKSVNREAYKAQKTNVRN